MSTADILAQLPRLSVADRDAVRARLDDLDSAAPLSSEERKIVEERVAAYRQNPGATIPWAVAEAEIRKQVGL